MSGIYMIRNKVTNWVYVGRTGDFDQRWKQHKRDLRAGRHTNIKLQWDWIFYGEDVFEFVIIEQYHWREVRQSQFLLEKREHFHISKIKRTQNVYNLPARIDLIARND